jgi:TRAP-type C4-dicarboxylate transport system permease small subunit
MYFILKANHYLNRLLVFLAGCCLLILIFMTSANVLLRIFWKPIPGTFELMGYFGALLAAFALGHTQMQGKHIAVDVLVNKFSAKHRTLLRVINNLVCGLLFATAGWRIGVKASILMESGEVTETLRIAYYPFTYAVALGFFILTLVLVTDLLKSLLPQKES